MVNRELTDPKSIVIVGGSNDLQKPGGKILKNIIDGGFNGTLMVMNPKEDIVQGVTSYRNATDLPPVELAVMAIASRHIPETAEFLANEKGTRAFIVISAGFSEENEEGKVLEKKLVEIVNKAKASLIGPNCIGVLTPAYHGVFTLPIPKLSLSGCDFISGSGATACFIMENGIQKGLTFARVFSVGNSAQMGVEDILRHMDESFDPAISPRVKLLYMESVQKPEMLLRHASSLIKKGCRIAAVKAGASEAGSRAASSHTGALASSDLAVSCLLRKAGIIRCQGREELINVASVLMHKELQGKNIGIVTHAGGPAVMLTDALSREGFSVPRIENPKATELLQQLYPGSSVSNPVDFLATGTAEQLGTILDYTDEYFDEIDGIAVIFGTPGLSPIFDVYDVLHKKMQNARKPIYPILPSTYTASEEVRDFLSKGRINFPDEVLFAHALGLVYFTPKPSIVEVPLTENAPVDLLNKFNLQKSGYLPPDMVSRMLDFAGIPRVREALVENHHDLPDVLSSMGGPVVMKVIGPVHKSDVGGVILNIRDVDYAMSSYKKLMSIPEATIVLVQQMLEGQELFAGIKYEKKFGHILLCGMGGIFIEVLKDFSASLTPLSKAEADEMIRNLRIYPMLKGIRGQKGINLKLFADILVRLSNLVSSFPQIMELDLNPLMASGDKIYAVDARIRIGHT
ncbi:MAG TPA: acetate--CoA ligase family protein [Bacteroidales bacterium]|nr:acetate--CoA ligase family protein [Bacteroidales bacterium]